jgi:hypothetical protein
MTSVPQGLSQTTYGTEVSLARRNSAPKKSLASTNIFALQAFWRVRRSYRANPL